MKKYDFVHFFMINSSLFNKTIQEMIQEQKSWNKHLFVYRFKENYEQKAGTVNTTYDAEIIESGVLSKYLVFGKFIVIHGLAYGSEQIAAISTKDASRILWCVWGSDLYKISKYDNKFKEMLREVYQVLIGKERYAKKATKVISGFGGIAAGFEGDLIELRKRYGQKVPLYNALYPMGYFLDDIQKWTEESKGEVDEHEMTRVLIGHSAYPFLKHEKYIKQLKKYRKKIELYLPLSYGNAEYAAKIEQLAYENYDNRQVIVLRKMMDSREYFKVLSQIDVAIFDYAHQAAYGNIILLLYLNKKIYLSNTGIMYQGLKAEGLDVYSVKEILTADIEQFKRPVNSIANYEYAVRKLDKKSVVNQWNNLFLSVKNKENNNYE